MYWETNGDLNPYIAQAATLDFNKLMLLDFFDAIDQNVQGSFPGIQIITGNLLWAQDINQKTGKILCIEKY